MLASVAIDLALDRLFTYEVPESLEKKLSVGQLLSVPFGHREARGFVLEMREAPPEAASARGYALKPISAIVDETPFFTPQLLTLVRKVAAYTGSPIESVLKAALPAAVLRKNAHARELLFVEPALAPTKVEMTKRRQWLYDQIVRLGGGWMASLCAELGTTPTTIRELGRLGLVTVAVRAKRRDPLGNRRILPTKPLKLNPAQAAALDAITAPGMQPVLLFGVTGSGKTEVYLQAIARELEAGRGAIVMVPEISLTPQTVQRFASRFGNRVAVLHSALSDGERYDEWHRIRSGEAQVVVGPRSAVWAPVRNLGLVVVDEEHETSYKQEELPRYHARDVAVLRGAVEGVRVVLGSATPSLESWHNVSRGKYALAKIACRAGAGTLPQVRLVDMSREDGGGAIFSKELLEAIRLRLQRGEQTILFLNRRGFSRTMTCAACGHVMRCEACDLAYTYHRADSCLRCHLCGGWAELPAKCPACGASAFSYEGIGTQRAEAALKKCFPQAAVLRMDADSTSRKTSHDDLLGAFARGEADVLVGTQMIAKGLDFPNVTLVGVLNADATINQPDFRAVERAYQLMSQVAGRAGRSELAGEVFIQSRDPSVGVIQFAARNNYEAFAASELATRREYSLPPFVHLATVDFRGRDLREVGGWAEMYAKSLEHWAKKCAKGMEVEDAAPDAIAKADDQYRWRVVLRAPSAAEIVRAWRWIIAARPAPSGLRITLDVDAYGLG